MKALLVNLIGYITHFWICCPKCGGGTYTLAGAAEQERCSSCDWRERV